MADSLLKKKKKDEAPAFQWVNDPGIGASGRRLSGDDTRGMLQYNRDQNIRINGQPARLAGDVPRTTAPTWQQPLDRAGLARITSKYGSGQPAVVTMPANPNLGPGGPTVSTLGGLMPTAPTSAFSADSIAPQEGQYEDSRTPGVTRNPDGSITPPNPNLLPPSPSATPVNPALSGGMSTGQTNFGQTGEELGGGGPGAPVTNPLTGAKVDTGLADWKAAGGSDATWHRQQVRSGLRAPIDAHATPDPQGSTAGAEIRAAHGWGATNEGDAVAIAKQMTGEFNQNNAASQAAWNKKFTDAHDNLMRSLNNN